MIENIIIKLAKALDKGEIPYMIIGGQAVLLYGEPRMTKDIDITLGVGIDMLSKIINIVGKIGFIPIPSNFEAFVKETYVLPVKEKVSGIRTDFIFSYTSYEKQALQRINKIKVKNCYVKFASIEDTIIHKIFAGRARDLEDVRSILLKHSDINNKYIKKWLKTFGVKFMSTFNRVLKDAK